MVDPGEGTPLIFRPNSSPPPHPPLSEGLDLPLSLYGPLCLLVTYVVEQVSNYYFFCLTSFLQMEKEQGQVFTFCYSEKIYEKTLSSLFHFHNEIMLMENVPKSGIHMKRCFALQTYGCLTFSLLSL